ncbi:MAG: hypothetical protein PHW95_03810 [Patescibacteria group bacterium]|nr:hypothetical protein [Patescibacteria group bacterium]
MCHFEIALFVVPLNGTPLPDRLSFKGRYQRVTEVGWPSGDIECVLHFRRFVPNYQTAEAAARVICANLEARGEKEVKHFSVTFRSY